MEKNGINIKAPWINFLLVIGTVLNLVGFYFLKILHLYSSIVATLRTHKPKLAIPWYACHPQTVRPQQVILWFVWCMYVWGRLHVQGLRIPGRARRSRKFTDFVFENVFYSVKLWTFWRSGRKHPFGWWKIKNRSRWLFLELNSRNNHRDRIFENFPRFLQMAESDELSGCAAWYRTNIL